MNDAIAIRAEGLGKCYRRSAGRSSRDSFREVLINKAKSLLPTKWGQSGKPEEFWALRNASFEIRRGENVGIVGLNGAGKSTLLKVLSRITEPTTGSAQIRGRVGALLEVGTGFHGELTGRENVYLYGTILGMTRREISKKFDAIVDFAGIPEFIDTPVKRYSSGMYVRLAFAVAAHLDPKILLLDEVLAVGDITFQRKCIQFSKDLQKHNATILLVSHNMFSIKSMCQRVIYLRHGQIQIDGPTEDGITMYEEDCRLTPGWGMDKPREQWPMVLHGCDVLDDQGTATKIFDHGQPIRIRMSYETRGRIERPNFIVAVLRSDGVAACNYNTENDGIDLGTLNGSGIVELRIPPVKLVSEMYTIHVLIREPGFGKLLCSQVGGTFHVRHPLYDHHFGVFHEPAEWSWSADRTVSASMAERPGS